MNPSYEINFDGLVGPTHHYGGLSFGNVASTTHSSQKAFPKEAALQGLKKMKFLKDLGLKQAIIPPQERPEINFLRQMGFIGNENEILVKAYRSHPELLSLCSSASCMWTANAATISPSPDTFDKKVHFTPANLVNKFHRFLEAQQTARTLKSIFKNPDYFVHHSPLPSHPLFGDEGAANHTRFSEEYGAQGIEFFTYGQEMARPQAEKPKLFPARQTYEASEAISRLHLLDTEFTIFAQQNPEAIDQGVFHNDVISVGNLNFFFCHEKAFLNQKSVLNKLKEKYRKITGHDLFVLEVSDKEVPLSQVIKSYLFNSQLILTPSLAETKKMTLIAPMECKNNSIVGDYLNKIIESQSTPLTAVHYMDVKQSMQNGGGPACLRLRVVLNEKEIAATHPDIFLTDELYSSLVQWVNKNYRDSLTLEDLADPKLLDESRRSLDELTQILNLGSIYPFQLNG